MRTARSPSQRRHLFVCIVPVTPSLRRVRHRRVSSTLPSSAPQSITASFQHTRLACANARIELMLPSFLSPSSITTAVPAVQRPSKRSHIASSTCHSSARLRPPHHSTTTPHLCLPPQHRSTTALPLHSFRLRLLYGCTCSLTMRIAQSNSLVNESGRAAWQSPMGSATKYRSRD